MRSASILVGREDAPRRVLIVHGYTASPDEFQPFAEELADELDAQVSVPLLPGHGTHEKKLLKTSFDDLLDAVRLEARKMTASGKPFAICGHSLGGYFALLAGAEVKASAIALTVIPYQLRFPYSLPGMPLLMQLRNRWGKHLTPAEREGRRDFFFYTHMPGIALSLVEEGNKRIKNILPTIACPILTIHTKEDPIALPESGAMLLRMGKDNPDSKSLVLEHRGHSLFSSPGKEDVQALVLGFLKKELLKS